MTCFVLLLSTILTTHSYAQPRFKVIAFYNGTWDAAHINFVAEARQWFPQMAAQYNFSFESTNNWSLLNTANLAQYQVVMFLDDSPPAAQRPAFEQYMRNGGGWFGFHVCAFNTNPGAWGWYHNQFLGTGAFRTNTWGPTPAILKVEDQTHPSTVRLPQTFTSAVSEWYGWNNDLRNNANIKILASVDPASFPLGTDPNQSWYNGYYPIMWTNRNYKMIYANFGHNDMDYANNVGKSSTFASEIQNRFIIDALLWLGGVTATETPIPGTVQAESFSVMSGVQLEATTDTGGGQNVGYIDAGDWMDYRVNVQAAGSYQVQYRVASQNGGGSIQLRSGTSTLATTAVNATNGWQTWTTVSATVNLAAGAQTLRLHAAAGGFNLNWIQFTSGNTGPTVSITSPVNNASFTPPANINIQATAADANGAVTQVAFYNGTTLLGTDTSSPYSFSWTNVAAGTYTVTARATDNGGATTTSSPITVRVNTPTNAPIGQTITLLGNNGRYVNGMNGTAAMQCNSAAVGTWEKFVVVDAGNGKVALRSMNKYVSSENGAATGITCNRAAIGGWEVFDWIANSNGTISLRGNNGFYVSSENGTKPMTCTRATSGGWEMFTYAITSAAREHTLVEEELKLNIEHDLTLSPNPAKEGARSLTLNFDRAPGDIVVDFRAINGTSLFSQEVSNAAQQVQIGLPPLAKGMYLVKVKGLKQFVVKKYLIE
ncbi:carbohydrate-binding protein [Pseudochryseolinea flava]|uniref:carbohydrate-binding protein n=1 Tax=Pseudochryseolinea flava TaxID=2059302 RepID=UPI001FECF2EB|nr:carbohydrate-binding protein [Pseudochryseolinea flava]